MRGVVERELLRKFGHQVRSKLVARIPKATGKTHRAITVHTTADHVVVSVPHYIMALEHGRGPRKSSVNQGFAEALMKWMRAVGFGGGVTIAKARTLASAINMFGTRLHQQGGNSGVITGFNVDKELGELMDNLGNAKMEEVSITIKKRIKTKFR